MLRQRSAISTSKLAVDRTMPPFSDSSVIFYTSHTQHEVGDLKHRDRGEPHLRCLPTWPGTPFSASGVTSTERDMITGMKRKETGAANELLRPVLDAPSVQVKRASFSDRARPTGDHSPHTPLSA